MFNNEETFNNGNSIRKDKDKKQRFRDPIKVVVEAIRISRARRYPNRLTFYEFLHLFGTLAPEVLEGNHDEKVACQMILDKKGLKGYKDKNLRREEDNGENVGGVEVTPTLTIGLVES